MYFYKEVHSEHSSLGSGMKSRMREDGIITVTELIFLSSSVSIAAVFYHWGQPQALKIMCILNFNNISTKRLILDHMVTLDRARQDLKLVSRGKPQKVTPGSLEPFF